MSRVLQAVDSIHQVGIYCLALVPPNYLPKVCTAKLPAQGSYSQTTCPRYLQPNYLPKVRTVKLPAQGTYSQTTCPRYLQPNYLPKVVQSNYLPKVRTAKLPGIFPSPYPFTSPLSTLSFSIFFYFCLYSLLLVLSIFLLFHSFPFY